MNIEKNTIYNGEDTTDASKTQNESVLAIVLDHNNVGRIVTASEDNDNVLRENVLLAPGKRSPNRNELNFTCMR